MTALSPLSRLGRSYMIVRSARTTLEGLRISLAEAEDGRGSWMQDLEHIDLLLAAVIDLLIGETTSPADLEERCIRFVAIATKVLRKIDLPSGDGAGGERRLGDWCLVLEAVALLSIVEEELVRIAAAARGTASAERAPAGDGSAAPPRRDQAETDSDLERAARSARIHADAIAQLIDGAHGAAERLGEALGRLGAAAREAPPAPEPAADGDGSAALPAAERMPPRRDWLSRMSDVQGEIGIIARLLDQARERFAAMSFAAPGGGRNAELDAIEALVAAAHGAAERLGEALAHSGAAAREAPPAPEPAAGGDGSAALPAAEAEVESTSPRRDWPVGNVADVRSELGVIARVLAQARERFAEASFAAPGVSRAGAGTEFDAIEALVAAAHGAAERLGEDLERLEARG